MKNKPIILIAGEPYSVFSEIFFKVYKLNFIKKYNYPIIFVGSKNLIEKQMKRIYYLLVCIILFDCSGSKTGNETDEAEARKGKRDVDYALDGIHQTTLYDGDKLLPSMEFIGPAIIEDSGATTVIHPENKVYIDGYTNIHIEI